MQVSRFSFAFHSQEYTIYGSSPDPSHRFYRGNTLLVTMAGNGNVGIGSSKSSPQSALDVGGTGHFESLIVGNGIGAITFNVCSFFTGSGTSDYFHLQMPPNFNAGSTHSHMFHIHVTGYAFYASGNQRVIDITFVGYKTPPSNGGYLRETRTAQISAGGVTDMAIYHGRQNRLFLRFRVSNTYYTSFRVDSMYVGNGYILKHGDIEVIRNSASEL